MNQLIQRLIEQATTQEAYYPSGCNDYPEYRSDFDKEKFAELIVQECAKELREAEQEADRAYEAKEVKERNTFDGYDFADMLEERFGV